MTRLVTVTLNPALDVSTETDAVVAGRKLRCGQPRIDPGGGGVNVSRAAAQLGGDSLPLVAAGGPAGARLMALLRAEGLAPRDLGVARDTRESLSVMETATGRQFRFVMPGPVWNADDARRARDAILSALAPGDLLAASGSLPPGLPDDFFPALSAAAQARGAAMLLDTSGAPLRAAVAARAGLRALRMDDDEAASLAGAPLADVAAVADFAAALVADGVAGLVAVGVGAEGTVLADARRRLLVAPPRVAVVSAVGAGDSFVAAFGLALTQGADPADACVQGVAAAAAAVTTPDTRLCDRETVARLLRGVVVRPI